MKYKYMITYLVILIGQLVYAQDVAKRTKNFNTDDKLAIGGYDPVSYFSNKPIKGKKELAYTYEGVIYRFSSQANFDAFKSNPGKYEPAYGGWCAYAMGARGERVEVDPETFKIIDGKVYLFYNKFFTNTLPDWNKDEPNLKKKADSYWTAIIK